MFDNITIVKIKDFKPEEPYMTDDERARVIQWNSGKLILWTNLTVVVLLFFVYRVLSEYFDRVFLPMLFSSSTEHLRLNERLIVVIVKLAIYALCLLLTLITHELCHLISYPKEVRQNKLVIILYLPVGVAIAHYTWVRKRSAIISFASPAVLVSLVVALLLLIADNQILKLILLYMLVFNVAMSVSDIVNTIVLARIAPKQSLVCSKYILPPYDH